MSGGLTEREAAGQLESPSDVEPRNAPLILVLVGYYLPGYKAGGPIRSIENLVAALRKEFEFKIVTLDRDFNETSPFPGIVADRWVRVGNADVQYLRPGWPGMRRMYALLRSVNDATVLYLNSICSLQFSILAILMCRLGLCRPQCLVLAPRGELAAGALHLKRLRKLLYIRFSRWLRLYDDVVWHASSEFEAEDIRRQFPYAPRMQVAGIIPGSNFKLWWRKGMVITASDIAGAVPQSSHRVVAKRPGQLRIVFVARCARNKNLSGALRMLAGVSGDISFDIYGPLEDKAYWEECQGIIATLPRNIRVRHQGEIHPTQVGQVFAEYDLFLFPTLGENYGHVIHEALASGCPILISDRTPWRNLEAEGVGWDIPLGETERFRSVLQQCVDSDGAWLSGLSEQAMKYAAKRASNPKTIAANRALFQVALARPDPGSSSPA